MADDKPTTITSLGDLHLDTRNANRGTARGRQALADALRDHGAGRSILVDHAGRVVAGNKVAAEAAALHLPVTVVRTSGDRLVIVQRTDLDLATDPKARQLALADNRVGELNLEWDDALLREFANEGLAFDALWTDEELEQLFGEGLGRGQTDADAVIEPGATNIVPGDLFALGDHRLLCGDATVAADVARVLDGAKPALMVTDPPYGVAYDPAWRAAAQPQARTAVGRVANDDRVDWSEAFALFPGSTVYLWHAGIHAEAVAASLRRCEFVIRSQIVWVKQHFALSRGHYHWQHEPCWYAVRTGQSANWCGSRTQSTVWQVPNLNPHGGQREGENAVTGHSTQKPVRLFEVPILNHTGRGEAVYEPFCGSGTALIAAEKTGRRCLAIELDPRYVQAAITRWEAYSGTRATRLSAGGGR